MNPPKDIVVNGVSLPRKYIHEAGHAVTSATLSTDPVSLCDQPDSTDEGKQTAAMCIVDVFPGEHEPIKLFFECRIAAIYAGVLAEAFFEVGDETFETYALRLWENIDETDSVRVEKISICDMPKHDIHAEDALAIRKKAWNRARQTIPDNKESIVRVAIALHESGCLTDAEIRALLTPSG
ncbi:MAG: hypothetical protein ABSA41_09755 [Terriglobia bacterium]|jgi:hypothetical protein